LSDLQYAFIDEFGNYGFDFDEKNVSTHLIIVSILVKGSDKEIVEQEMEKVRQKYFLTEEMKSSKIENNDNLRIQILNDIKDLPFHVYAYVIDKRKIREDSGVTFKKTFIKFFNRLVYEDLIKTFKQLDLVADENGTKEFMAEFKDYIKRTSIPDLFSYSTFGFNNTKSDILLQLADFIAGTIAKGYDKTQYSEHYSSFYKAVFVKFVVFRRKILILIK
jgi:hypothetical protein